MLLIDRHCCRGTRPGCLQGGTDVDAPLIRSLEQLDREEWAQADIMMVTDGEIRMPGEEVQTCVHVSASFAAIAL